MAPSPCAPEMDLTCVNAGAAPVLPALDDFVERYLAAFPHLADRHDPDWRSTCEHDEPYLDAVGERRVAWRPQRLDPPLDHFAGLERALGVAVHPALKGYYGRYWSGGLEADAPDGHVSLLLLWNPDDAERLVENLIGHVLAKRRAGQSLTLFFACTEVNSDLFLSIDNHSGRVLLEEPGRPPLREVAASLADFLATLHPAAPDLHPERP